jgi:pimeloyl-ACP methyl ester carboxylesterase
MKLSPRAADFAVFLARPFPCAVEFQPSGIEHDICGPGVCTDTHVHRNRPASTRKRRIIQGGPEVVEMKGPGHFPMSEDPARFRTYILPVLEDLRSKRR